MNSSNFLRKACAALLFVASACSAQIAQAQQAAGRVLVAAGEVSIMRGVARVAVQRGTEVFSGDTILVGERSNTQILFSDESIIALRPDTTFRVTEYAYIESEPDKHRSAYELVAGGFRTVTGLIGKLKPRNFAVRTPTSTIGIRGTHFSLVECNNNCRNPNGTLAPNGTYGGVTDGRISVTNQSGEHVFGADQYFQVASQTSAPVQLIAPPGFLRDTLEGRARNQRPQESTQAASGNAESSAVSAQTGAGAGTADFGVSASVTSATSPAVLSTNVFQSTAAGSIAGPTAVLLPGGTGTVFFRLQGPFNIPVSCSNPPCNNVVDGEFTLGVNLSLLRAGLSGSFKTASGEQFTVATPIGASGIPITISGGQASISGSFNLADFPQSQGALRCSACGPGNTLGFLQSFSVSGNIAGSVATLTFSGIDAGGSASFPLTLTQQAPPNTSVGAIAAPRLAGGTDTVVYAFWDVQVDPFGKLLGYGPRNGAPRGAVDVALNTISGAAPAAGNLVWGFWSGSGSLITDSNYASVVTGGGATEPWITGIAPNALPPSLGTLTYTPVGSLLTGAGVLNSASITADFVNRSVSLAMNATNPSAGNTFQMNAVTGFSAISGRFSAGFNNVTCAGPCGVSGPPSGSFGGFFAGANAEGAGVAFSAGFATGSGGVTGVVALKR